MTRRAYDETRAELEALEAALKRTIPPAIQKARELGDLRGERRVPFGQAQAVTGRGARRQLVDRLREVTLIDDRIPSAASPRPGTEVLIELDGGGSQNGVDPGRRRRGLGPDVVSYRAAVGLALLGHKDGRARGVAADGRAVGRDDPLGTRSPA